MGQPVKALERRARTDAVRLLVYRLLVAAGLIGLWEFSADRWIDPFWFSSPGRILRHLAEVTASGVIFRHLAITLWETLAGFTVGGTLGIAIGVVLSRLEMLAKVLDPFIVAVNGIPRVALAPMFIIWFGIGTLSKIILASTLVFFITFYNTFAGLRGVEPALKDIARVMGAGEGQIFWKVSLPAASPWIVTGLKVSVPFALIGAIIGEFMAASRGLGYLIQLDTNLFNTTGALAGILVLMAAVMVINGVLTRLERWVLRWRPVEKAAEVREVR